MSRDIALWVCEGTSSEDVESVIKKAVPARGGVDYVVAPLVRITFIDEFTKSGRTSFAFRLVFQSMITTLTDGETNEVMEMVYKAVGEKGWEVR